MNFFQEFHDRCLEGLPEFGHIPTIRSIWSMSDKFLRTHNQMQYFMMTAWKLTQLHELYVGGRKLDDYDLVGLTRLRPCLRIHVPKENIRATSFSTKLNKEKILPIDRKLIDISVPLIQREALILSTIASIDSNFKKVGK